MRDNTHPYDIRGQHEAFSAAVDCDPSTRYVPITTRLCAIHSPGVAAREGGRVYAHRKIRIQEFRYAQSTAVLPSRSGVATSSCLHGDRSNTMGSHPPSLTVDDTGVLRTWSAFP